MQGPITSAQNPFAQSLRRLSDKKTRDREGLFLAEGPKLVSEALSEGLPPARALLAEEEAEAYAPLAGRLRAAGCDLRLCAGAVLRAVSETRTPQGICAAFPFPAPMPEGIRPRLLVALDGVQDPGNAGGICRTADAAGFGGMLLSSGCADLFSPKAVRSAMGSAFRLPMRREADLPAALESLRGAGYRVLVTALDGAGFFAAMPGLEDPCVLVIGSEGHGVCDAVRSAATDVLRLPMPGRAESLNANVAAGIMLYALALGLRPR